MRGSETPGGGGGGGGVKTLPCLKPLGAQKIHPVTIYLTKNFHMHTLYWYIRTDSLFCCVSSYIHKNLLRPARAVTLWSRTHRRWSRDRGPVINIVVPHAPSLVPRSRACHINIVVPHAPSLVLRSRACHKHCGPARTVAGAEIAGLS